MKVTIRGRATTYFNVSREDIGALRFASERHYDLKCRAASMKIPEARVNGLIAIWNMFMPDDQEFYQVSATFDELDLLAKITETFVRDQHANQTERIEAWHHNFLRMMTKCDEETAKWVTEVEL